jgi:hypothetical protein
MALSAGWLRAHLGARPAAARVSTPLPPRSGPAARPVARAALLERWPVQLAWLLLPALALAAAGVRALRRRGTGDGRAWRWLGGVVALDVLALATLAFGVATIVEADGRGLESVAGAPAVLVAAWVVALAAAVATGLLARRRWRAGGPVRTVCLASLGWLLLVAYWLV